MNFYLIEKTYAFLIHSFLIETKLPSLSFLVDYGKFKDYLILFTYKVLRFDVENEIPKLSGLFTAL